MENENSLSELKNKSLTGIGSLFRRQVITKIISFLSGIFLARLLAPDVFGVYAIVVFVVQFFSTFGDVGIGAALIQKKEELKNTELSSLFWLQQILVCVIVVIVLIMAPLILTIYPKLDISAVWLVRVMAFSLFLASLKTIPAILLERKLEFNQIAWVDITETVIYQGAVIVFALLGFKVWSFILATLMRGLAGTLIIYCISPWRPTRYFKIDPIKDLLRFGIPYQGNNVLAFLKDAVTPLFVGAYLGATAVGYLNWARNLAFAPLLISESFGRVAFPSFSKIQSNKELLGRVVGRSIKMITLVMFPISALMLALGPDIIKIVFTAKWMPGIWAYYLYCTSPIVIGIVLPMYSAILALGKSKIILQMTSVLLILEWAMGITFALNFGFTGVAMNQPILAIIFFFIYDMVLKKEGVTLNIFPNISFSLLSSLIMGILIKIISLQITVNLIVLIALNFTGILVFILMIFLIKRDMLVDFKGYFVKAGGLK